MLLQIPEVLTSEEVARCQRVLDAASWVDGRVTAGHQSAQAKSNTQLPENSPAARELGGLVLDAPRRNLLFTAAALPAHAPVRPRHGDPAHRA